MLVSSDPPARVEAGALRWSLGTVLPGAAARVRLEVAGGLDTGAQVEAIVGASALSASARPAVVAPADPDLQAALLPTPDADAADGEVLALVARLGGNLNDLQAFVRRDIALEIYAGSLRGARGTLWSGAGNAHDQASLLVAAARAAGVPARYGLGTLDDDAASALIGAAFAPLRDMVQGDVSDPEVIIANLLSPAWRAENMEPEVARDFERQQLDAAELRATLFPDVRQDAALRAETRPHVWARLYVNGAWIDVDPTRDVAPPALEREVTELPAERRHHVDVRVVAESFNTVFGGALGNHGSEVAHVRLPAAALAGKPVVLRYGHRDDSRGGLVFATVNHIYTPILEVEGLPAVEGTPFQELITNFPGATTVLTGLFVEATLSGPGGENPQTFRHTTLDRLGFAVRNVGEDDVQADLGALGAEPTLTRFHRTLLHVSTSWVPQRAQVGASLAMAQRRDAGARDVLAPLQAYVAEHGEEAPLPAALEPLYEASQALISDLQTHRARVATFKYFQASGDLARTLAVHHAVAAWPDRPRLMFAEALHLEGKNGLVLNLARSTVRALSRPGTGVTAADEFRFTRGMLDKSLEGRVAASLAEPDARVVSWDRLAEEASAQGIQFRLATAAEEIDLVRLDIPADALARIREDLQQRRVVIYPEAPVLLDEQPTFLWLAWDGVTGEATVSNADGLHPTFIESAKLYLNAVWLAAKTGIPANALAGATFGAILAAFDAVHAKYFGGSGLGGLAWGSLGVCLNPFNPAGANNIVSALADAFKEGLKSGWRAFGTGAGVYVASRIARCVSMLAAYGAVRGILELIFAKIDPPVAVLDAQGFPVGRPIGTPDYHRAAVEVGPLEVGAVPAQAERALRLEGALSVSAEGALGLPPGQIVAADGQEIPVISATFVGAAALSFWGTLSHQADGAGGRGHVQAELDGALRYRDADGWHDAPAFTGRFVGEGPVDVPAGAEVRCDACTLVLGADGYQGFAGRVGLGETALIEGDAAQRLHLAGLPEAVVALPRGAAWTAELVATASAEGAYTLEAQGPAGWDVALDAGQITVRPAPEAAPGTYPVAVWVRSDAQPGWLAGGTVLLRVGEAPAAVSVALAYEPLFVRYAEGRHLPLAFPATITNHSETTRVFALTGEAPDGSLAHLALPQVTLRAGEQALVFLHGEPQGALPAPGTPYTVRVTAQDGALQDTAELTIPFPEVWGARAVVEPANQRLVPGESADFVLQVEGIGNVGGTLRLALPMPSQQVDVTQLPETIEIVPGEAQAVPFRLTLAADATLGLRYVTQIDLVRVGNDPVVASAFALISAHSAERDGLLDLAELARDAGRLGLAGSIIGVAEQLERIAFRCRDVDVNAVLGLLRAVSADLEDEVFAEVRVDIDLYAERLLSRDCADLDPAVLTGLLERLGPLLEALRDHDFRIFVTPSGAIALPGQRKVFAVSGELRGAQATTLMLTLEGVDGELESPVAADFADHPLTMWHDTPGRHRFRVVATPVEAPALRRVVAGVLVVADEWVRVAGAGADPPFALPGSQLRVITDLFNLANAPQDLLLDAQVYRPNGTLLWETGDEPVPFRLESVPGLQRVSLGRASLYGEPPGHYRVTVAVRGAADGQATPGGVGEGVVFVGQPITASLALDPPLLPPGDIRPVVRVHSERRPLEALPGLGIPMEIERFVSEAAGPSSVVIGPDGSVYFTSFGTQRSSNIPGFQAGTTVGRVDPFGVVSAFARVPPSPSHAVLGADDALYVVNVGNPERITRVGLADAAVSTFFDFELNNPEGGGYGENIVGLTTDAQGTLYGTELFEPLILGATLPGQRVYRIFRDANSGVVRANNLVSRGLETPTLITTDRRTQDLILTDSDRNRVVRINTIGEPQIVPLYEARGFSGYAFTPEGHLLAITGDTGEVFGWETAVVDGRTTLVGEPRWILGGMWDPIDLEQDANGNLITTAFELDSVVRIHLRDVPREDIGLRVDHAATDTADQASALPPAVWDAEGAHWVGNHRAEDDTADFAVAHDLHDLAAGDLVPLAGPTTVRYRHSGVEAVVELPPLVAVVDHLVGLVPDAIELRTSVPQVVRVQLRNHGEVAETYALFVEGLPNGVVPELPASVVVPPGEPLEVDLRLFATDDAELGATDYQVRVLTESGRSDTAVGRMNITGRGVLIEVDPPHQVVRFGEPVTFRLRLTQREGEQCRSGYLRTEGLVPLVGGRESNRLLDWYREPPTLEREVTGTVVARDGSYSVRFFIEPQYGCGGELDARATVTVEGQQGISVWTDPPETRLWQQEPFTVHVLLRNDGSENRNVRLSRCCGPAFWSPVFDAGPHPLGPGETKRIPVHMTPNGILLDELTHRFDAVDVDRPSITATHTHTVYISARGAGAMELRDPRDVVADANGEARFTVRFTRAGNAAPRRFVFAVDGAPTFSAEYPAEVVTDAVRLDVPVVLRGLSQMTPGPWPVRFRAWPVDQPDVVYEQFGSVRIPAGGLVAAFEPAEGLLLAPGSVLTRLVVDNNDFGQARDLAITWAVEPPQGLEVEAEATSRVLAGGRVALPFALRATAAGAYRLTATVTPEGAAPALATFTVRVFDPALAPRIEGFRTEPDPALEGMPYVLHVEAVDLDDPPEALIYDFDRDNDGMWDEIGVAAPQWDLLLPDDGIQRVRVAVQDAEGGRGEAVLEVPVLNVAPALASEPPLAATEGAAYVYEPASVDAGADPPVFALLEGPGAFVDGALRWTPTFDDAVRGSVAFALAVADGDGGSAEQRWEVAVAFRDEAGDGFPDTCVERFGVQGPGDDDADGRSNLEECLRGSDPLADGRPGAPELVAPDDEEEGLAPLPELRIEAAMDPDGDAVSYHYEIRNEVEGMAADALGLAAEIIGLPALEWTPEAPLADGAYRWRARASDGAGSGPWSDERTFWVGLRPLPPDLGVPDAGVVDAAVADAAVADAAVADAAVVDAAVADAAVADATPPVDAAVDARPPMPDTGLPPDAQRDGAVDVGTEPPDGGSEPAPTDDCGCQAGSADPAPVALLLLALGLRRRRRR